MHPQLVRCLHSFIHKTDMQNRTKTPSRQSVTGMRTASKRLFIALIPDHHIIDRITDLQKRVQGRLVPAQNLHLTLAFLGNQSEDVREHLTRFLEQTVFRPFELVLDTIGFFPKIRLSWIGPSAIPDALHHLHRDIQAYLIQNRLTNGRERFRPHITLARQSVSSEWTPEFPIKWQITRLALMQSVLSHEPGVHPEYRILYEKKAISGND